MDHEKVDELFDRMLKLSRVQRARILSGLFGRIETDADHGNEYAEELLNDIDKRVAEFESKEVK